MRRLGILVPAAALALVMAAPAWAADGILLVQKVTIGTQPAQTHQIAIEPRRMRAELSGAPGGPQAVVFDGARDVLLIINDANKTYSEMNKGDLEALGSQVSAAMAQMQEAMKNMPPEQRARVEAMMSGRGMTAGAAAPKVQYRKVGTDTVGKWTCDKYEGTTNGQKTTEICTVDPKVLGFTEADFAVTKELASFFQKLMPANASQMFHIGTPEEQGFSGVPVRSVTTVGGQTVTSEITDVKRQAFPDTMFQAPSGYAKQDMPFGRGRGRR